MIKIRINLLNMYVCHFIHMHFFSVQQDYSSEKLRLLPMCPLDQRLRSLRFMTVGETVFSFFPSF